MKITQHLSTLALATILFLPLHCFAESQEDSKAGKPKPYPLTTCIVSGEKLGDMGKPYVFIYEGREIKLCCTSCLKEFKKDPAKYIKKLEEAEKQGEKKQPPQQRQ
jgi:YHS domain-containing protein